MVGWGLSLQESHPKRDVLVGVGFSPVCMKCRKICIPRQMGGALSFCFALLLLFGSSNVLLQLLERYLSHPGRSYLRSICTCLEEWKRWPLVFLNFRAFLVMSCAFGGHSFCLTFRAASASSTGNKKARPLSLPQDGKRSCTAGFDLGRPLGLFR